MKIIEVPVLNEDGTVKFTAHLSAEEAQTLLQFAINYSASIGLGTHERFLAHRVREEDVEEEQPKFDD